MERGPGHKLHALFLLVIVVDSLLFPGCGVYHIRPGQNTSHISPPTSPNSLAMLSFMLQIWIHDKFQSRGIEQQRRTFRRGWAYLGGGDGDDEIVLSSGRMGGRRGQTRHKPLQRLPSVAEQGLVLYSSFSHHTSAHVAGTSDNSTHPRPTARSTTTRPQDLPPPPSKICE